MAVPVLTKTGAVDSAADTAEKMVSRVNERGAERIMSMVVNMYSNPNVAVAREYIANAVDATIVAGTGVPVEVSTPTRLNPNFVVADRGTGMSKGELEEAFLAFAASTKTDSNEVVGGLGVGAKSAWTICDAFLVNTVKDGKRNIVRASRDLEHEVLVSDADTDDPNGTTITVPVNMDDADWAQIVTRVAVVHPQGAVKVDGREVHSIHDKSKWIGPIYPNTLPNEESIVVVSGGTLFGVPGELRRFFTDLTNIYNAVIALPVGSFEHTPSREHLIPSEITKKALREAVSDFDTAHAKLTKKIATAAVKSPTKAMAMRAAVLGSSQSSRRLIPLNYHVMIPRSTVYAVTRSATASSATVWAPNIHAEVSEIRGAHQNLIENTVLVTGVPEGRQLKGIGRFMDTHHRDKRAVMALYGDATEITFMVTENGARNDAAVGDGFTVSTKSKGITVVSYTDLKKECKVLAEKARANRPARQSRHYRVYSFIDGERSVKSLTLTDVREIMDDNDDVTVAVTTHGSFINETAIGAINVVIVNTDGLSVNPVLKVFPEAVDAHDLSRSMSDKALSEFDAEVITAATLSRGYDEDLFDFAVYAVANLDEDSPARKYLQPMAEVIRVRKERQSEVSTVSKLIRHTYSLSTYMPDVDVVTADMLARHLVEAYPLIPRGYGNGQKASSSHILEYVRSVSPTA